MPNSSARLTMFQKLFIDVVNSKWDAINDSLEDTDIVDLRANAQAVVVFLNTKSMQVFLEVCSRGVFIVSVSFKSCGENQREWSKQMAREFRCGHNAGDGLTLFDTLKGEDQATEFISRVLDRILLVSKECKSVQTAFRFLWMGTVLSKDACEQVFSRAYGQGDFICQGVGAALAKMRGSASRRLMF